MLYTLQFAPSLTSCLSYSMQWFWKPHFLRICQGLKKVAQTPQPLPVLALEARIEIQPQQVLVDGSLIEKRQQVASPHYDCIDVKSMELRWCLILPVSPMEWILFTTSAIKWCKSRLRTFTVTIFSWPLGRGLVARFMAIEMLDWNLSSALKQRKSNWAGRRTFSLGLAANRKQNEIRLSSAQQVQIQGQGHNFCDFWRKRIRSVSNKFCPVDIPPLITTLSGHPFNSDWKTTPSKYPSTSAWAEMLCTWVAWVFFPLLPESKDQCIKKTLIRCEWPSAKSPDVSYRSLMASINGAMMPQVPEITFRASWNFIRRDASLTHVNREPKPKAPSLPLTDCLPVA